jgi:hypothetical protein
MENETMEYDEASEDSDDFEELSFEGIDDNLLYQLGGSVALGLTKPIKG